MANPWLFSLIRFAFLVLFHFHGLFALSPNNAAKCELEKLTALEPTRRVESEGGVTEYWDTNNEQFQCAGVAALRYTVKPKGLLLPMYTNAPRLHYVLQGTGILETVLTGCPETFQEEKAHGDGHQKIFATREGDVIVVPASSAQWIYNNGQNDLILFSVIDSANEDNQLDLKARKFFLAGKSNVLSGLAWKTVAESLDIDKELARKVQGVDDPRGSIIIADQGLDVLSPVIEEEEQRASRRKGTVNGLEETLCTLRLVHQIAEPTDADKYNPRAGYVIALNTPNLPVLQYLQLGVDRGFLYKNAMMVPHYNLNCHAVIYGTKGRSWIQVVANNGRTVYDGELKEGQVLIVPQNFVLVKKGASDDGFGWVAIKTSDNPMISSLSGRLSLLRAMPDAVLMNSYRLSKEEAKELKKRAELTLISPSHGFSTYK